MSIADDPYPGATAPPEAVAGLAGSYRAAAHLLAAHGDATAATGRAPWRLAAIHAVELYLNAYLRLHGRSPAEIRGLHHDMAKYSALAASCGLQFRAKTLAHLVSLGETRAYVVTRYDPARSAGMEPPNRVLATLDEVAAKVERA
ncbi:hypothetical protein [Oharaeibacter diazotrophicus]|uniref:HEPN domain-containing protein n=1 Tax=Oharaeibacter diazotrophicus TaxID=1920512 RepID=A0A4V3CWI4_9HYPH|nr:hypothetical protein [Oharaeibacter diazotrophicus]TDP86468.1 hypothetical protein EDD54_0343 [Oharaeibacter diazotrophicus]BBE71590.1 hypothetical protein OHA_1_01168 [Pleomorphomonas sp. SM30]GLS78352.1 hypothetical protein GCM10007904_36890 [Oharaeibacter diazotrophicus]